MAESTTTRFELPRWGADTDTPSRDEFDSAFANLEAEAAGFLEGTAANRPAASALVDRFAYFARDAGTDGVLYFCVDTNGSGAYAWIEPFARAGHNHDATYVNESDHGKPAHDALDIDADTVDGKHASAFAESGHSHPYASDTHAHALGDLSNVSATAEGAGGGLDADTVDGQHASAFAGAGHVHTYAVVDRTGTTYTVTSADSQTALRMTASSSTVTLPANLALGTIVEIIAWGGPVTIQAASGAAIRPTGASGATVPQYGIVSCLVAVTGTTEYWVVTGDYS